MGSRSVHAACRRARAETCVMMEDSGMRRDCRRAGADTDRFGLFRTERLRHRHTSAQHLPANQGGRHSARARGATLQALRLRRPDPSRAWSPGSRLMILLELERLACQMTFLRRSFHRDLRNFTPREIHDSIIESWRGRGHDLQSRSQQASMASASASRSSAISRFAARASSISGTRK